MKQADFKRKHHLTLLHVSGPLELVATDVFGLLPKTIAGTQFIVVIMDLYTKLTREIPSPKTTAPQAVSIFFDLWIVPYRIPALPLTNNGPQFVR